MHILLFPSWYSTDEGSYVGSYFREQARELSQKSIKVNVIYLDNRFSKTLISDLQVKTKRDAGFNVYSLKVPFILKGLIFFVPSLVYILGLRLFDYYQKQEGSPDLIHAHSAKYAGFIAKKIHKKFSIPYMITEHLSTIIKGDIPFHHRKVFSQAYKDPSRLFAVSETLAHSMMTFTHGQEIEVFENTVDERFFTMPENPIPDRPFTFVAIGSLLKNKGFDLLINAFHRSLYREDAKLLIAGIGSERDDLLRLIKSLGIENQVKLLGSLSRENVRNLLQASHVLISSSYHETFGITLIEGMACGLPVLSTRSGGPNSIVTKETGILIPTGDIEQLALGIKQIMEIYANYDRNHIRNMCINRFGSKKRILDLVDIYDSILQSKTTSRTS